MGPEGQLHLQHLRARNLRPLYIEARWRTLRRLDVYMDGELLAATLEDLRGYLNRGLGPGSLATEVAHLRGFYKWALLEGHINTDPTLRLERPKRPRAQPRPIPTSDLAAALTVAGDHIRPMLALAAYAGLRACEIAPLRGEDILRDASPALILITEGKGGQPGSVPISDTLVPYLNSLPVRGWCFPRLDGEPGHLSRYRICQLANGLLHGIGINATLHQLRHWFITEVYRATHDIRVAQLLARHASSRTTDGYTYISNRDVVAAVHRIPSVL